ncbi:MAG: transglycosylase domain-containing protein, partial [Cyanobium sp. LacPavin_0920_WC12_MAG_62_9]|nr:transglycosylase domain-containing protein [Cyanobium sp. LacPavin_0920_WC12_MAG_62_9]
LGVGWGFEDASRHYFGHPAAKLTLPEAALLVGLLPSPNGYDPCFDPGAALEARNTVLAKMADTGRISDDQARQARRSAIQLAPNACKANQQRKGAPFYTDQVRRDLEQSVGSSVASEGNFLIDTHLNPTLQAQIEQLLRQRLAASRGLGIQEGAVVALDSRNGGILAIAGGRDYRQSQFNRASMALRQPGSAFKLILYGSDCRGMLSLSSAFASSSNTAALRLGQRVGLEAVVQKARDLGMTSPLAPVPGLVLGQSEVNLVELTAAYGAVANNGVWHAPTTIRRLTDAEACTGGAVDQCRPAGNPQQTSAPGRRIATVAQAQTLQQLLRAVVQRGTGTPAYLGGQEGGKTGTTNGGRDLLFIGYEPRRHWVIGIWLGNDDNSPTQASSALAAGLWGEIIRATNP